jgi:hypothetical protein
MPGFQTVESESDETEDSEGYNQAAAGLALGTQLGPYQIVKSLGTGSIEEVHPRL